MSKEQNKLTEIERLKKILSLPTETLQEQGISPESLILIQQKLVEIESNLLEIEEYKFDNKIEDFSPNPPQLDFLVNYLNPQYETFTYTGGNRRGKTCILVVNSISVMIGHYLFVWECKDNKGVVRVSWDEVYEKIKSWEGKTWELIWIDGRPHVKLLFSHHHPRKVRYIGQGWEDHVKEVIVQEIYKWWPKARELHIKKNVLGIETWWTDLKTNSIIRLMSNDQPMKKFAGTALDLLNYDEPCKREIYFENAARLVDREGKECFGMTLLSEAWIHREIIRKVDAKGKPDPSIYNNDGTTHDNLGFGLKNERSIDVFSNKLTKEERDARILGIPSYLSGIIFGRFSRVTHLKTRFPIPLDWPIDIAIDFHPKIEQAVLFQATDRLGYKYLVDEIWEHGNVESIGNAILRRVKYRGYRVNRIIIDPATKGQGENVTIEKSVFERFKDFFRAYGHYLETGSKRRTDGIILCKDRLFGLNKEPSIKMFDDLVRFIYEIEGWMYNVKTQKPVDKDDHMMEDWGRLELLDTKYTPMIPPDIEEYGDSNNNNYNSSNYNSVTGY